MFRIVIAEDSLTARQLLLAILSADPEIQVVGLAGTGTEAVRLTQDLRPDAVLMDIRMPEMDGLEATRQIMKRCPTPIVIISAAFDPSQVEFSLNALQAGALTALAKPAGPDAPRFEAESRQLCQTLKALAQVKVVKRTTGSFRAIVAQPAVPPPPKRGPGRAVIAVAASTGGPAALRMMLSALPDTCTAPILVVQHMSHGFLEGFVHWLARNVPHQVKLGQAGMQAEGRTVYVAPDDRHLELARDFTLRLSAAPPVSGFRPSANVLFESSARAAGAGVVAVILTGMGDDGVHGLAAVHAAGGRVLAQDEATCAVFGMPAAALAAGVVDAVLPLQSIARALAEVG